jgi:4-hydroxy-tetrahydrodipicolinate reductase
LERSGRPETRPRDIPDPSGELTRPARTRDNLSPPSRTGEIPLTVPLRIAVAGALGRMGQAMVNAVAASDRLQLTARCDRPDAEGEGLSDLQAALAGAEVVIDFSTPAAATRLAEAAAARGGPALVLGPTGFSDAELARIDAAAARIPIVRAGNFSLGLNMLMGLAAIAARALPAEDFDIEITEAHHRRKVDAPSGAALMLGAAVAKARGVSLDNAARRTRDGITGARPQGEIGFSVLRGGGIVGEHAVVFAGEDEILTLSHSARDRGLFARGAIEAALWVAGRRAGLYDMQDVLGV